MTDLIEEAKKMAERTQQLDALNLPAECCAKCKFVTFPPEEAAKAGMLPMCRRYPPSPFIARFFWDKNDPNKLNGNSQMATQPYVNPFNWCGEFKLNVKGMN